LKVKGVETVRRKGREAGLNRTPPEEAKELEKNNK